MKRLSNAALAGVAIVGMSASAFATGPTVGDVITSTGITTTITDSATALATLLGVCLIVWFGFRLFYKGRRAAGKAVG